MEPEDEDSIVDQEEAYRRINAQLELNTRKLMRELQQAIHADDNPVMKSRKNSIPFGLSSDSNRIRSESEVSDDSLEDIRRDDLCFKKRLRSPRGCYACSSTKRNVTPRKVHSSCSRVNYKKSGKTGNSSSVIPNSARGIGSEGIIRFLQAKVKVLQEDLTQLRKDNNKMSDNYKRATAELKSAEEEKYKSIEEVFTQRDRLKKQQAATANLANELRITQTENSILKKEIELLKHDVKRQQQNMSGNDLKLNHTKEDAERLRQLLKKCQLNEKEIRDKSRAKTDELMATIRKLERHKSQLLSAFKKQLQMIDNLKRRKPNPEVVQVLELSEGELLKLFEWKPEDDKSDRKDGGRLKLRNKT